MTRDAGRAAGYRSRRSANLNLESSAMKLLLFSTLVSLCAATAVPRAAQKVNYDGFKVLRLSLPTESSNVRDRLTSLVAHVLNPGRTDEIDVVVSPQNLKAVEKLAAKSSVVNEDVGAALKEEGEFGIYAGQSSNMFHATVLFFFSSAGP
jgi:hypothetical protein